jgi:predicted DNA-binding protein YlxM (UPF0122 family)
VPRLDTLAARQSQVELFERYGSLLTDHQRQVLTLYLRRDWSLAEIAAHQSTSRAAVHDLLRRAGAALEHYEGRLGLVARDRRRRRSLAAITRDLQSLHRRLDAIDV